MLLGSQYYHNLTVVFVDSTLGKPDTSHHVWTLHPVNKMKIEFKCQQVIFIVHQAFVDETRQISTTFSLQQLQDHVHHIYRIMQGQRQLF